MKSTGENKNIAEGRQTFLRTMLALGAGTILFSWLGKSSGIAKNKNAASGEKIKMLTADGKLVEVDKAFIKGGRKASGNDIKNWLNRKI